VGTGEEEGEGMPASSEAGVVAFVKSSTVMDRATAPEKKGSRHIP
jgi:hypothetical protein